MINPSLVPTKQPGALFNALTGNDPSLSVRWYTALDPVYFEVLNRPIADVTVRQLVLAKAIDTMQVTIGRNSLFPYLNQPRITSGTTERDIPIGLIWDFHASMPKKWQNLRLAKIKRIAGENSATGDYTGRLQFIFTANVENSTTEVAIFKATYQINSDLAYQLVPLSVVDSNDETTIINPGEEETVSGFVIFKTLDLTDSSNAEFFDLLEPPTDTTDANSDANYDNPAVYDISDSVAGGAAVTDDFSLLSMSHGTGLLTVSAYNSIPQLDSDIQSWILAFNYPFDSSASRTSTTGIIIPNGLFKEFDIAAPAGDQPTGDDSGLFYQVWISRIEKVDTDNVLRFYFATYNVTDDEYGGASSTTAVEFATLDLSASATANDVVSIIPILDLKLEDDVTNFGQNFGRGHVVLSSLWDGTSSDIEDFFSAFDTIVDNPVDTSFSQSSTRISSFGISRVPKQIPTISQSNALLGSTSRRTTPVAPSYDNRYVTEADQGVGNQIDFDNVDSIASHEAIDRYGYSGSLTHKIVKLVVDSELTGSDPNFYTTHILPRLVMLLGRNPMFGDFWYNGTRLLFMNGDSWQG